MNHVYHYTSIIIQLANFTNIIQSKLFYLFVFLLKNILLNQFIKKSITFITDKPKNILFI